MKELDQNVKTLPSWRGDGKKVLILATSPRENGNSHLLAQSLYEGALEAKHDAVITMISPYVLQLMRYCGDCRDEEGNCGLQDDFSKIFRSLYQPAEAVVFATPIWWYGMSGHMKNFLDRISCEISARNKSGIQAKQDIIGKKMGLLLSAEESNFACRMPIVAQFNELCRHLRCPFVGHVSGFGNLRGEVSKDPLDPLGSARKLGHDLFDIEETDYELDSERPHEVWSVDRTSLPNYWR
ncbi:flavodoxin family protein [Sneathiella aquimaris]|uniref:flavodoxin family protein n=1 Tax=Sneathiella aquimaris TaxID=2599305 RepID=UPI00146DC69E|nr:flavodoxin family protein [Sneathiella aquimaris]